MMGRKIATQDVQDNQQDYVMPSWTEDQAHHVWDHLGQHVHPHDTETQRALWQNNGSIMGTTQALHRVRNSCPNARKAFALLAQERPLGHGCAQIDAADISEAQALSFNGLKEELVALDIHEDHYAAPARHSVRRSAFSNVQSADFKRLLGHMPNLQRIEITCAPLSHGFIDAMVQGLEGHLISTLILHHCSITADDLAAILAHMGAGLRHLDISYNDLSDHGVGALDFSAAPSLEYLDLSHCNVDLADLDLTPCEQLRVLNLSSNRGGSSFLMGHDMGAMAKLEVLQLNRTQLVGGSLSHLDVTGNPALHTLDLGYNALRNDDMHKFDIARDAALQRLNVSGNAIGAAGFITLQRKSLPALQELDFADNQLHDYSQLQAMHGASLACWPALQVLDLAGCDGITRANIRALGLQLAPRLECLDLSATQLSDAAFIAIPWAQLPALRIFRAEFSHISQQGITQAAFHTCSSLQELDLQHHDMAPKEALEAFLSKPVGSLSTLRLMGDPTAEQLDMLAPLRRALLERMGPEGHLHC